MQGALVMCLVISPALWSSFHTVKPCGTALRKKTPLSPFSFSAVVDYHGVKQGRLEIVPYL